MRRGISPGPLRIALRWRAVARGGETRSEDQPEQLVADAVSRPDYDTPVTDRQEEPDQQYSTKAQQPVPIKSGC
jgi:hypothetical protein